MAGDHLASVEDISSMIAGVDGCKAGWVAVIEVDASTWHVQVYPTFADLLRAGLRLVVIDVPIGVMTAAPRAVDRAARKVLRHRACCVFSAPYRPMLAARSHAEACAIRERIDGKRCSRQAFEIFAKIREVDACMTPSLQERVVEGHPEVSFAVMQGGRPIEHRKKSRAGHVQRLDALRASFPEIDASAAERRSRGVGRDDLLDAYAMLWTARRIVRGIALRLPTNDPDEGQRDAHGLRAEMLA